MDVLNLRHLIETLKSDGVRATMITSCWRFNPLLLIKSPTDSAFQISSVITFLPQLDVRHLIKIQFNIKQNYGFIY